MCLERTVCVFAVLRVLCVFWAMLVPRRLFCSYISSLCHAWMGWMVVVWVLVVCALWGTGWPALCVCGVPVGVDGHGDSRRDAAGVTMPWWCGDTERTCPVCLSRGVIVGRLLGGSPRCRVFWCRACLVVVIIAICTLLGAPQRRCWLDLVAGTLIAVVGLWRFVPVLVLNGSVADGVEFASYLSVRRATGEPWELVAASIVVLGRVLTLFTLPSSSSRGIRVAGGTHYNAICVWMALLPYWVPWVEASGSGGAGVGLPTFQSRLSVCMSVSGVEISVYVCGHSFRLRETVPIGCAFAAASWRVHMVVAAAGLSGGWSSVARGCHAWTAGGMIRTVTAAEQRRAPCSRDDATGLITAAPTCVGVRSRDCGVAVWVRVMLDSVRVMRLRSEVLTPRFGCGCGVCGVAPCVLVSCALVVVCRRAQYRGSCLFHVGRRSANVLRA